MFWITITAVGALFSAGIGFVANRWSGSPQLPADVRATQADRDPGQPLIVWGQPFGASKQWAASVHASTTDVVDVLLDFVNIGNDVADHAVVSADLPLHVRLVAGSVLGYDTNHPNGQKFTDAPLTVGGYDLGRYGVHGGGYIRFQLVVLNDFAPSECDTIPLTVTGHFRSSLQAEVTRALPIIVSQPCSQPG